MKEIISRAMSSGMDFTRGSTIKAFLARIDIDQDAYDRVYITLKNMAFKQDFTNTHFDQRIVLLPHCLRNVERCEAEFTELGYICAHCGACDIGDIKKQADELGYKGVFVVPGGSMARKVMEDIRPSAVVGVACFLELAESMEQAVVYHIIPQGVPLLKDGCIDTVVDKEELKKIMKG